MADATWYYAIGDTEKGPVPLAELKALVVAGKLRREHLVWQEGMENWQPAGDVAALFTRPVQPQSAASQVVPPPPVGAPPVPGSPQIQTTAPAPRGAGISSLPRFEPLAYGRQLGQPLLLFGLLLVLLSKGCDALGSRYADRLDALKQVTRDQFQDDWDDQVQEIEGKQRKIRNQKTMDLEDEAELEKLDEEIAELNKKMQKRKQELEQTSWREMDAVARDAAANNRAWGFWREMLFVAGTILLSVGLLAVGFAGDASQRWICMVMLAIIVFSVYIVGNAWP